MNEIEILKGLKRAPYDFIANNYYKMDKEQLKDIILELICIADDLDDSLIGDEDEYRNKLVRNLIDMKSWNDTKENEITTKENKGEMIELRPHYEKVKSYYKNAYLQTTHEETFDKYGERIRDRITKIDLYSYNTLVMTIYKADILDNTQKDFYMIYSFSKDIYTKTTARHIKECLKQFYSNYKIKEALQKDNYHKMTLVEYNMKY